MGRSRRWRAERDGALVDGALARVQAAAAAPMDDLMAPIVDALDRECSIGEIAGALRAGYGLNPDPFATA